MDDSFLERWCDEQEELFQQQYEAEFQKRIKSGETCNFSFWNGKDIMRLYKELFKEMENDEKIDNISFIDKICLLIIIITSIYNSGPDYNVPVTLVFFFTSPFVQTGLIARCFIIASNCHVTRFTRYYRYLKRLLEKDLEEDIIWREIKNDGRSSSEVEEDKKFYMEMREKVYKLDNTNNYWGLIFQVFDFTFYIMILIAWINALHIRYNYSQLSSSPELLMLLVGLPLLILFSYLKLSRSINNWKWLRDVVEQEKLKSD